jgi:hypothetical protein
MYSPEDKAVQKFEERKIRQRIPAIFNRFAASQICGEERQGGVKVVAQAVHLPELAPLRARVQRIAALRIVGRPLLIPAPNHSSISVEFLF